MVDHILGNSRTIIEKVRRLFTPNFRSLWTGNGSRKLRLLLLSRSCFNRSD